MAKIEKFVEAPCKHCAGTGMVTVFNGRWVKAARKALGMTQKELGDDIECSSNYISMIETNKVDPSEEIRERIRSYLVKKLKMKKRGSK